MIEVAMRPGPSVPLANIQLVPEVNSDTCANEPIRVPGSIQAHGAMLVFEPESGTILRASGNAGRWLPVGALPATGGPLRDLLGAAGCASVRQALAGGDDGMVRHRVIDLPARPQDGQPTALEAVVHAHGGNCFVEVEPAPVGNESCDWSQLVGETIDSLRGTGDLDELVAHLARRVKGLTRMDRVMVYRFDEQWNGRVVADCHEPDMESFHDLHFPAGDIPAQARELYRTSLVRYIADVDYAPVAVLPTVDPLTQVPLDMSYAMLRGIAPMHLEYMRNMGVSSSLTISLLVDDKLWGLIACHHRAPLALPIRLRRACDVLAVSAGYMVGWQEQRQRAAATESIALARTRIVAAFNRMHQPLTEIVDQGSVELLRIAGASGGALWRDDVVVPFGEWPGGEEGHAVLAFARDAFKSPAEDLLCTDSADLPALPAASRPRTVFGVAAIRLGSRASSGIVWIRREYRREVAWGGDPDKPGLVIVDAHGQPKLHPRTSFARWVSAVTGRSRAWTELNREALRSLLTLRQVLWVRDSLAQVSLSDRQFRSLVTLQSDVYWQMDANRRLIALSKPLHASYGTVIGRTLVELFAPYCDGATVDTLDAALTGKKPFRGLPVHGQSGPAARGFDILLSGEPLLDQDGLTTGWHGTITDETKEVALQEKLRMRDVEQGAMLDNDMIAIIKIRDGRLVWKNKATDRIFGFGAEELYGGSLRVLHVDDEAFDHFSRAAGTALRAGGGYRDQVQMTRKDGKRIWIDVNGVRLSEESEESLWLMMDITPMKKSQEAIEHIAHHDALTGLPNRRLLADRMEQSLASARRYDRSFAVAYIDLDRFKQVNDEFGHAAGDAVLKEVAARLLQSVRANDTVCRLGGDEFVLVLSEVRQATEVRALLERIILRIELPVLLPDGRNAHVSATVGVAMFPQDGDRSAILLEKADKAMFKGKERGRNQVSMQCDLQPAVVAEG